MMSDLFEVRYVSCSINREQVLCYLRLLEVVGFEHGRTERGFILTQPVSHECLLYSPAWYVDPVMTFKPSDWVPKECPGEIRELIRNALQAVLGEVSKAWVVTAPPDTEKLTRLIEAYFRGSNDSTVNCSWTAGGKLRLSCQALSGCKYEILLLEKEKTELWYRQLGSAIHSLLNAGPREGERYQTDFRGESKRLAWPFIFRLRTSMPYLVSLAGGGWSPVDDS